MQNGRAASFFVDVADFQRMREAIAIMDDVRAAEEEIERGETFSPEELRARLHAEREAAAATGRQSWEYSGRHGVNFDSDSAVITFSAASANASPVLRSQMEMYW